MTKLTQEQAHELVKEVWQQVSSTPSYRFGQALWNNLPSQVKEIQEEFWGTDKDFFYWTDTGKVYNTFYENFVE